MAGLVLAIGACSEGLGSINRDPNAPTDVGAQFLLPQAIRVPLDGTRMPLAHASIWSQHTAQIQYPDEEQGNVRPEAIQEFWDSFYAGPLKDIQTVLEKGRAGGQPNVEAVGLIWRTWIYSQITDLWGDVPYSEALRAEEDITTPAYDAQQAIYTDLIQMLKTAEGLLTPGGVGFGSGDILYGNDFEKWRRFSVSLRMRLAMRLSEVAAGTAQTEFVAAYNAGGFQSNADNATLNWPGPPYEQPLFENWTGRDDDGVSATMIDTLVSFSDPRLELYAEPAVSDGAYRGLQNNQGVPPLSIGNYSRIGNFWRADGAGTPSPVMTYSEVLFLQAEAAQRGWIVASAATLYEDAIRANMNQWDPWSPANAPTDAEIDAYVLQPAVVYNAATGMAQIQLQKWFALYMQGNEAFANQRRIDLPALALGPDISFRPVRFYYPAGEQSLNAANLADAVENQMSQGDARTLQGRVWWDVVTPP
ncbi:MAG: SusD/RagB family nutrient-binding outer membrane lipoprotein [Gemmatimonadales bacterium]